MITGADPPKQMRWDSRNRPLFSYAFENEGVLELLQKMMCKNEEDRITIRGLWLDLDSKSALFFVEIFDDQFMLKMNGGLERDLNELNSMRSLSNSTEKQSRVSGFVVVFVVKTKLIFLVCFEERADAKSFPESMQTHESSLEWTMLLWTGDRKSVKLFFDDLSDYAKIERVDGNEHATNLAHVQRTDSEESRNNY